MFLLARHCPVSLMRRRLGSRLCETSFEGPRAIPGPKGRYGDRSDRTMYGLLTYLQGSVIA